MGDSGHYGSNIWARFLVHNTYRFSRRKNRANVTPFLGPTPKKDKNFNYKRDSFNVIPQILDEKIIDNIKIKDSCDPIIIDTAILKPFPEGNHEALWIFDQSVITFGTRKIIIGLLNKAHVESRDIYPI